MTGSRPFRRLGALLAALVALPTLVVLVHLERRRARSTIPRVFWRGTAPQAEAVRRLGYPTSVVGDDDVDALMSRARVAGLLPAFLRRSLAGYWAFAWALKRFDIFVFSSDATTLRRTPLRRRELQLLRLARKKVVFLPSGTDVRIASRARNLVLKHALSAECPSYVRADGDRLSDLEYCSRYADHIVSGADWVDYMPWWDRLTLGPFAIDLDEWKPEPEGTRERGTSVVVLHASSTSGLEGAQFLVRACAELAEEGLPIELRVVERQSHETMRRLVQEADIVADQFVSGWYAQLALEGMSKEKPVLCYLRPDLLELYSLFSFAGECPIVNTPPFQIKENLRDLVTHPEKREELGRRGRLYVREHHSLESLGAMFEQVFTALWRRAEAQ